MKEQRFRPLRVTPAITESTLEGEVLSRRAGSAAGWRDEREAFPGGAGIGRRVEPGK